MKLYILIALCVLCPNFCHAASKPNIVVILSDDFGYGSLGCYGGPAELKTPHLDRLAVEGRKFTHSYAPGSVCSPTRYGLLTGRYFWRTNKKDGGTLPSGSPLHIEPTRLTLASLCKGQGYATAAVGKWHLGVGAGGLKKTSDWSVEIKPGPLEVGFDYFFGLVSNPGSGPHNFIENHHVLDRIPGEAVIISGEKKGATTSGLSKQWQEDHIMENLTGKAVEFVEQHAHEPFFLYFAPNAVHNPIAPNPKFKGSKFGAYGDFIEELDWSVGQVLGALERRFYRFHGVENSRARCTDYDVLDSWDGVSSTTWYSAGVELYNAIPQEDTDAVDLYLEDCWTTGNTNCYAHVDPGNVDKLNDLLLQRGINVIVKKSWRELSEDFDVKDADTSWQADRD